MLFLPLTDQFVALLHKLVLGEVVKVESGLRFLDELLLESSDVAIDQARQEIVVMAGMAKEMLDDATEIFRSSDTRRMAGVIGRREDEIDDLELVLRQRPIQRLRTGVCDPTAGILYVTVLSNFERISDHCTNIAERGHSHRYR